MGANKPIGSHFVAQRILGGFVDPSNKPFVWVYEKGNPEIGQRHPRHIAAERGLYGFPKITGGYDHESVENLSRRIENDAWPVLDKLEGRRAITKAERGKVAMFLGFQFFRTPHFMDTIRTMADQMELRRLEMMVSHPDSLRWMMERARGKYAEDELPTEDEIRQVFQEKRVTLSHDRSVAGPQLRNVPKWAEMMGAMAWVILTAPRGHYFVSSDSPLARIDPETGNLGTGFGLSNTEMSFAISKTTALLGVWEGRPLSFVDATPLHVDALNARTVGNAVRWVYAPFKSDRLNAWVQITKGSAPTVELL